jgi:hypothetical protein
MAGYMIHAYSHKKKKKKTQQPKPTQRQVEVGDSTLRIESVGEIGGQKFIVTTDLSIAATGIRPF